MINREPRAPGMRRAHYQGWLFALLILLAVPAVAWSQTATTASISGTVTDPSGAVLPGVQIELQNKATGQTWKRTTNASGQYVFSRVSPGEYALTFTMQGFRKANVSSVKVEVAKSYSVDMTLEVGDVVETVDVTAGVAVELQKADATVGNVIASRSLLYLPSLQRNAVEFLTLQPGSIPEAGDGDFGNSGGAVTGARSDQNTFSLDGIDITDNSIAGGAGFRTIIPVPVDSVEEFRVGVTNPNATFARSAGAQVALVGRRGSNEFHGAAYWYHQNDNLNANSWTNNRNGIPKAELKDNRYGFRVGGPIWRNHTFFFVNYEGRDFPRAFDVTRIVPTETLRRGIVRFRDGAGNIVSYDLANSRLCGPNNDQPCDPRGLGLSPSVSALWSLLPQGNDPGSGDGLNTIGFRSTASAPLEDDYFVFRFDHHFSQNWRFDGSATYFRELATQGGANGFRQQLDIRGGRAVFTGNSPQRGQNLTLGLTGTLTPTLTNSFRFGWTRDRTGNIRFDPSAVANLLAIPGTNTSAGHIALNIGGGTFDQLVSEPIDVGTQRGRTQSNDNEIFQFVEDATWIKGNHTFQFGANIRHILTRHIRNDKVLGSLGSLVADVFDGNFINIPDTARPPTCAEPGQTNCLQPGDVNQWNQLFAAVTGMVDTIGILIARDGDLNPLPFGTPLIADTSLNTYDFHFQDTWQLSPSFTLTLGLSYGWQEAPKEKLGRQTFMINNETGEILTYDTYIQARRDAALRGEIFNPEVAFLPIKASGRKDIFDIDWNNVAPRVAAAWNPSFTKGLFGKLFGDRKTVLRGGFGLVYDRINTVQSVIIPMLGVGFGQTINVAGPDCTASGAGGPGCDPNGGDPVSAFRVGVDGDLPLPTVPEASVPVVPRAPFGEILSFQMDPDFDVGKNFSFDFTIQRELPGDMLLELGWVARLGRDLPSSTNFNSSPFFHVDPASGQTFAQAFDAIAEQLRAGVPTADIAPQPWFENQMPGGTAAIITGSEADFINGNVSSIFQRVDLARLFSGLTPFNNLQNLVAFVRTSLSRSNYHALVVTLRKRMSHGLTFDLNYTFSKSLDESGAVQNSAGIIPTSFFPGFEYGPSFFDRTHVFNGHFLYELPAGRGHRLSTGNWADKILGGWTVSGIFRAASGLPVVVSQGVPALGGGAALIGATGAIPLRDPHDFGNGVHSGVTGSNNIGTNGDPANGGSGLNIFADPEAVFNSFRRVRLSEDGRSGRANPLRGFSSWNLDLSLGKRTQITETVSTRFSFDFFNLFNHPIFSNPSLNLLNPRGFGVVTQQTVPTRRQSSSRWIQFGFRVEF
ncbi:MAG: carboxypeptidase regulatory-like domain-containing protein [Acidobacteria bacterium]|nr:MAG: carboxypeptidase regulatory-like domain-containing protein [Acidobacteriota bacterium]